MLKRSCRIQVVNLTSYVFIAHEDYSLRIYAKIRLYSHFFIFAIIVLKFCHPWGRFMQICIKQSIHSIIYSSDAPDSDFKMKKENNDVSCKKSFFMKDLFFLEKKKFSSRKTFFYISKNLTCSLFLLPRQIFQNGDMTQKTLAFANCWGEIWKLHNIDTKHAFFQKVLVLKGVFWEASKFDWTLEH